MSANFSGNGQGNGKVAGGDDAFGGEALGTDTSRLQTTSRWFGLRGRAAD